MQADKAYKKRALGNVYKTSPTGGSSHAKGIVLEKVGVELSKRSLEVLDEHAHAREAVEGDARGRAARDHGRALGDWMERTGEQPLARGKREKATYGTCARDG